MSGERFFSGKLISDILVRTDSSTIGKSFINPAKSATQILNLGTNISGYYWIKPDNWDGDPQKIYCDMSSNGGGWMLMSWTNGSDQTHRSVRDENTWSVNNGGATSIFTDVTSINAASLGQAFINRLVLNHKASGLVLCYRITGSGTNNFYFNSDSNAQYLPLSQRGGNDSTNRSRVENTWLKTCNTGYTTSGGNGAGQASGGTSITYGGETWGVFPFNMVGNYSGNWGSAIDPTYNSGGSTNLGISTTWPGGHNYGWGQSMSMWIKVSNL